MSDQILKLTDRQAAALSLAINFTRVNLGIINIPDKRLMKEALAELEREMRAHKVANNE